MTEQVMTTQELAEAREFVHGVSTGPWKPNLSREHDWCIADCGEGDEGRWFVTTDNVPASELAGDSKTDAAFIAAARTLVPRLLATVDALIQRAERAEGDNAALRKALDAATSAIKALTTAKEQAEGERDKWEAAQAKTIEDCDKHRERWKARGDKFKADRDEALALADARGRALEPFARCFSERMERQLGGYTLVIESEQEGCKIPESYQAKVITGADFKAAQEALSLTAPEALRQQQEREAGKDALIERLRAVACHDDNCFIDGDHMNGVRIPGHCTCWLADITPPQALREREERVGALETQVKALEAFRAETYRNIGMEVEGGRQ